jgi:hypothetical protein
MKKFYGFALAAIISLALIGCEDGKGTGTTLSLTINNQSSYVLSDVTFSGEKFSVGGSNDLPVNANVTKQFATGSEAGFITFTRNDIGTDTSIS